MTEERNRIPRVGVRLPSNPALARLGEDDPVHRTPQQPVRPVRQQIANIHQDRRRGVPLGAGRRDGHRRPPAVLGVDLQAGLPLLPEQQRDRSVVRVGAGAHVLGGHVRGGQLGERRVVQEAQGVARGALLAKVGGAEEVRGRDVEAYAEQVVDLQGEGVAEVPEGADLGLVGRGYGLGQGLLGFVGLELAEVEGSGG